MRSQSLHKVRVGRHFATHSLSLENTSVVVKSGVVIDHSGTREAVSTTCTLTVSSLEFHVKAIVGKTHTGRELGLDRRRDRTRAKDA